MSDPQPPARRKGRRARSASTPSSTSTISPDHVRATRNDRASLRSVAACPATGPSRSDPTSRSCARGSGVRTPSRRYRYAVRICPEPEHWGGLSGCAIQRGRLVGQVRTRIRGRALRGGLCRRHDRVADDRPSRHRATRREPLNAPDPRATRKGSRRAGCHPITSVGGSRMQRFAISIIGPCSAVRLRGVTDWARTRRYRGHLPVGRAPPGSLS